MNIENKQQVNSPGWFDKTKQQVEVLAKKYNIDVDKIIELGAYFITGFFAGILIKRFGRAFIFAAIVLILSLFIFENLGLLQIDWFKIKDVTGISPQESIGSLFTFYFNWIKVNLSIVISTLVGLGLGYKVG